MTNVIDDSGRVPTLKNRRVNILDVMATIRINPNPNRQFREAWNLSDDEIEDIKAYMDENKDELEELQSEISEEKEIRT